MPNFVHQTRHADELHFGRTAARLRVAQSAVSYAIKTLEQELGLELFMRTKRKVALAPAGESFRGHAAQSLQLLEQAATHAGSASRGEAGRLALRFSLMAGLTILPRVVARFQRVHPGVELHIEPGRSVDQLAAIRAGRCDIGFMAFKRELEPLATEPVQTAPLVAIVAEGHRLAARKRVPLSELTGERLVFLKTASEPQVHLYFRRRCLAAGFEPNIVFEIEQLEELLAQVAAEVGVACVSGLVCTLAFPGVILLPLDPSIPTGISAVWEPHALSAAGHNFLALLREERTRLASPRRASALRK